MCTTTPLVFYDTSRHCRQCSGPATLPAAFASATHPPGAVSGPVTATVAVTASRDARIAICLLALSWPFTLQLVTRPQCGARLHGRRHPRRSRAPRPRQAPYPVRLPLPWPPPLRVTHERSVTCVGAFCERPQDLVSFGGRWRSMKPAPHGAGYFLAPRSSCPSRRVIEHRTHGGLAHALWPCGRRRTAAHSLWTTVCITTPPVYYDTSESGLSLRSMAGIWLGAPAPVR